jgi:7,8-dihydropterin-6-yl-methyl-4-(beta-D-ribofuranosyl)aminobenzene 5'-phosphate synthase
MLYSCNEQDRRTPISGLELKEKKGDCFTQDAFLHEHYLVIEEDGKRVLISGCSHKGILDLAAWFKPDILIGGFHFSKITKEDVLIEAAEELSHHGIEYFTCHCTGIEQYQILKTKMRKLHYLACGDKITV